MLMHPYPDSRNLEVHFPLPIKEYVYHREHVPKPSKVYEYPVTQRKPEVRTKRLEELPRKHRLGLQ